MKALYWTLLDGALTVVHLSVVLALLSLWIPKSMRRAHLGLVALTALSWFGLGLLYDRIGYCFLSDWHWQVKRLRGETNLPGSFIHYVVTRWLGLPLRPSTTDILTGVIFGLVACASIALDFSARRARRRQAREVPER